MANDGRILGHPPVDVRAGASRAALFALTRGGSSYEEAAGRWGGPFAMPMLQHLIPPSTPHRQHDLELVQQYALAPNTFKARLARMFGTKPISSTRGLRKVPRGQLPDVPRR